MTKTIVAGALALAFVATAAQAQIQVPSIYAPSFGTGYGSSAPIYQPVPWIQPIPASPYGGGLYTTPSPYLGDIRPCVPGAGDRC